jgi:hypothetical protein
MRLTTLRTLAGMLFLFVLFGGGLWIVSQTMPRSVQTGATNATARATSETSSATAQPTALPTEQQILGQPVAVQATAYTEHCIPGHSAEQYPQHLCAELKRSALDLEYAQFYATATAAAPTIDPQRTATPLPTQPLPTPYVLSDEDLIIKPIDLGIRGGGDPYSLWSLGVMLGSNGEPYDVRLSSDVVHREGQRVSILALQFRAMPDSPYSRDSAMQNREWVIPNNPGITMITGVSGQRGIVSLVGERGELITFDLTTEQWTFQQPLPSTSTAIVSTSAP